MGFVQPCPALARTLYAFGTTFLSDLGAEAQIRSWTNVSTRVEEQLALSQSGPQSFGNPIQRRVLLSRLFFTARNPLCFVKVSAIARIAWKSPSLNNTLARLSTENRRAPKSSPAHSGFSEAARNRTISASKSDFLVS